MTPNTAVPAMTRQSPIEAGEKIRPVFYIKRKLILQAEHTARNMK